MAEQLIFEIIIDGSKSVNNLNDLKAELKRLKAELQNAKFGSEEFKQLSDTLKSVEGQAKQLTQSFKSTGDLVPNSIGAIKNEIRELTATLDRTVPGTREFDLVLKELGKRKGELKEVKENIRGLDDGLDNQIKQFAALGQSIAGAFGVASSAAVLFGEENEELSKSIAKVQASMNLLQSIEALAGSKDAVNIVRRILLFKSYKGSVDDATAAQRGMDVTTKASAVSFNTLKVAIASTGIGLLVVAIGELVANFDRVKEAIPTGVLKQLGSIFTETRERAVGAVYAIFNAVKAVGPVLKDFFTGNWKQLAEDIRNVGNAFVEGNNYGKGIQRARDAANARIDAINDEIKALELRKEKLSAAGKDTAELELEINRKRLQTLKQGSEDFLTLQAQIEGAEEKIRNDRATKAVEAEKKRQELIAKAKEEQAKREEETKKIIEENRQRELEQDIANVETYITERQTLILNEATNRIATENLTVEQERRVKEQANQQIEQLEIEKTRLLIQIKKDYGVNTINEERSISERTLEVVSSLRANELEQDLNNIDEYIERKKSFTIQSANQEIIEAQKTGADVTEIKARLQTTLLNVEQEGNRLRLQAKKDYGADTTTEEQAIADTEVKIVENKNSEKIRFEQDFQQKITELRTEVTNTLNQLLDIETSQELARVEESKSRELQIVEQQYNNKLISQTQYETRKKAIEEKAEKDKRRIERDAAIRDREISTVGIIINTASAIAAALAPPPKGYGPVLGPIMSAVLTGIGALQIATVQSQPLPKLAMGGIVMNNSSSSTVEENKGGIVTMGGKSIDDVLAVDSSNTPIARVNRGEAVINARSTRMFAPILSMINEAGGGKRFAGYAEGGIVGIMNFPSSAPNGDTGQTNAERDSELLKSILFRLENPVAPTVTISESSISDAQSRISTIRERAAF